MSLYGNRCSIGGVSCGIVLRGTANGEYRAVFEREFASLEDIEGIQWDRPQIQGECILPAGYGFTVRNIQYSAANRSYMVILQVAEQYLGDVTGYQSQVADLESEIVQQKETIAQQAAALEKMNGAAAQLNAAYQEGVEQNG